MTKVTPQNDNRSEDQVQRNVESTMQRARVDGPSNVEEPTAPSSCKACKIRKRSDELAYCVIQHYSDRHEDDVSELRQWKRQNRILDDRATSLLRTATDLETALRTSRRTGGHLMRENAELVDLIVEITRGLDPVRTRAIGDRLLEITAPVFNHPAVIDLTSDEEL